MTASKAAIISQLRREILPLQGLKYGKKNAAIDLLFGEMNAAFPQNSFPLGAVHEFLADTVEDAAATCGFIAGIAAALLQKEGAAIWISRNRTIFPPALARFGIAADKIIFIQLQKEKELLWAMEEALKCEGLCAVIGEITELNFTASRRLQLAVEESKVTGFLLRRNPRQVNTTACVSRWKISSHSSQLPNGMPGIGLPHWNVSLLKIRNGKPGNWTIRWNKGRFSQQPAVAMSLPQQKKAV